jgi:PAS domain S-box-containing protein
MLGYDSAEELISATTDTAQQVWLDPNGRSRVLQLLEQHQVVRGYECQFKRKDGTAIWVSLNCRNVCGKDGRPLYNEGFIDDITERKEAEARLQAQRERFQRIIENTEAGYYRIGMDGCYEDVNPAWLRMHGFTRREDAIGLHFSAVQTPEEVDKAGEIVEDLMRGGPVRSGVFSRLRRDGTIGYHSFSVNPVLDGDRVIGVEGFIVDITELKRAEAAKAKTEDQLRQAQKLESVGRLAGGVAHDFNNLLTVINGFSRLLLGNLKAGDPLRDRLEEILKAGERAAGLTQQLLAFSRKQILQPRVLDLNRVVEEMRPMLERLMGENVEVCVRLHAEAATIRADPNQLEQVVMNLAVNSRDAMPHGGKLSMETGFVEWGESHVQSRPGAHPGPYVMLAVSDTGEGMSEETRGHIFEPFFTTKEVGKGTGLGLSTIHGIVEQSGGYVEAASELGRGTTFNIYLPRVVDAQADSGKPEAVPAMGGQETVLVVEDQAVVRRYAAAALRTYGYQVIEAENAAEALLLCERESERIDLILTDLTMPGLSGRELADRLKKRRPGIRVLFMSGYTDDTIVHQGALEDGVEFIQKPFGPGQLAVKVREMLVAAGGRLGPE